MTGTRRIAAAFFLAILIFLAAPSGAERPRSEGKRPGRTGSVAAAYLLTGGAVAAYIAVLLASRRRSDRRIARLEERMRKAAGDGGETRK